MKDIVGLGTSPRCSTVWVQSMVLMFSLGGVPVFNLPVFKSNSDKKLARFFEGFSPILPPSDESSPVKSLPFRKVPAVKITLSDLSSLSFFKTTPLTL